MQPSSASRVGGNPHFYKLSLWYFFTNAGISSTVHRKRITHSADLFSTSKSLTRIWKSQHSGLSWKPINPSSEGLVACINATSVSRWGRVDEVAEWSRSTAGLNGRMAGSRIPRSVIADSGYADYILSSHLSMDAWRSESLSKANHWQSTNHFLRRSKRPYDSVTRRCMWRRK